MAPGKFRGLCPFYVGHLSAFGPFCNAYNYKPEYMHYARLTGAILLLLLSACRSTPSRQAALPTARNVILMIGDGMGTSQITAAMLTKGSPLAIEQFPVAGIQKPHAADELITDSAASATAFATGNKTVKGAIGVNARGEPLRNIIEEAEKQGYATGLVTTATVVHATPAAFFAHVPLRNQYEEIAQQLAGSGLDFFIGGGQQYFTKPSPNGKKSVYEQLLQQGYEIESYQNKLLSQLQPPPGTPFGYFTAEDQPEKASEGRTYLPDASRMAARFLQQSSTEGFFLMIEGAQIDWAGHDNDQDYLISEMLDFDRAVAAVLQFAERNQETLVIVTSDHETGGYSIQPGSSQDSLVAGFSTNYHTGTLLPVFAFGPGAAHFRGFYDNTDIYHRMRRALNWQE